MRLRARHPAIVAALTCAGVCAWLGVGCNAILGNTDRSLYEADAASDTSAPHVDGATSDATDAGAEAAPAIDCLGASVVDGGCVPQPLLQGIFASNSPTGLATDGVNVYYALGDAIYDCAAVGGCSGDPGMLTNALQSIQSMALVGDEIYFTATTYVTGNTYSGGVYSVPKDPSAQPYMPHLVAPTTSVDVALVPCGAGTLCWLMGAPQFTSIMSCPTSGCTTPTTILALDGGLLAGSLASDGVNVYAHAQHYPNPSYQNIIACPVSGCTSPTVLLYTTDDVYDIATHDDRIFFTVVGTGTTLGSFGICKPTPQDCMQTSTLRALEYALPHDIAIDDAGIVFSNSGDPGSVWSCDLASCGHLTQLGPSQARPTLVATDGVRAFWVDQDNGGAIMWVAR